MATRRFTSSRVRVVLLALLTAAVLANSAIAVEPRRVAITVDDLPWVEFNQSTPAEARARHLHLVDALARHHSKAIGFVNEDKLYQESALQTARRQMLDDWLRRGLDLGNHTFGHVGLHATPIADYEQAILRGEEVLRPLMQKRGHALQWFRHPYLQAGRDDSVRNRLDEFLAGHGYRIAPVTIDNGDWIFARAYVNALNAKDVKLAADLRARFIGYIEAKFDYYEQQSKRLFGREIPQVLLLHASALNAAAMDELLQRVEKRGYTFVTLDEALRDPAYAHADGYRGGAGISWMHRWAMAEQRPRVFYDGEPEVPADVMALAGVDSE
jgi:peptidoglycan/xylan/chitin deacetylase (PgdA/CDA1 family)